jgi:hypothetical protein
MKKFLLTSAVLVAFVAPAIAANMFPSADRGTYTSDNDTITVTNEGYTFEGSDGACTVIKSKTKFDQSTHVFSLTFRCAVLAPDEPGSQRVQIAEEKWHFARIDDHKFLVVVWDHGKSSKLYKKEN